MRIRCYLAMTCAEFSSADNLPPRIAWMACHFSCYGTGLSNLPPALPKGSMVIINDRTPPHGHDPHTILHQLQMLQDRQEEISFLFDFQRPEIPETKDLVTLIAKKLNSPFAVTEHYAKDADCAVFIQAAPPHIPLDQWIAPWQPRKIWLEIAQTAERAVLTEQGCHFMDMPEYSPTGPVFYDDTLHSHYHTKIFSDHAEFFLYRNQEMLPQFLNEAENLGIDTAIGLFQQFRNVSDLLLNKKAPEM